MIRETLRLLRQTISLAVRSRRPALWLFVVLGLLAAVVAAAGALTAPLLIYPVL